MEADRMTEKQDRWEIANSIKRLSERLSEPKQNEAYLTFKIGTRNAINVWTNSDHVSFYLPSTELLEKARAAGFEPEEEPDQTKPRNTNWFKFWRLSASEIEAHEELFREIVQESMKTASQRENKS